MVRNVVASIGQELATIITYSLTPWSSVLLEKLTGFQVVKKFPAFYGIPHSQVPATCPYPEPALSSPYPNIQLPESHLNIIIPPIYWVSQVISYPQVSPPKPCVHLCCPPYKLRAPPISSFSILSPRAILGEEYRSLSSSLCSFLHPLVTLTVIGPNTLLNTLFSNTLSLRSSLNVSDQVSHPYRTTGNIRN